MGVAQPVLIPVGLAIFVRDLVLLNFFVGTVPIPFDVDTDSAVQRHVSHVDVKIRNSCFHDLGDYLSRLLVVRDPSFERRVRREKVGDRRGKPLAEVSRQLKEPVRLAAMDVLYRDSGGGRGAAREHRSLDLLIQILVEHTVLVLGHRTSEGYPASFSYDTLSGLNPQFDSVICALVDERAKFCLDLELCPARSQLGRVRTLQDVVDKEVGGRAGYDIDGLRGLDGGLPREGLSSESRGLFRRDLTGFLPGDRGRPCRLRGRVARHVLCLRDDARLMMRAVDGDDGAGRASDLLLFDGEVTARGGHPSAARLRPDGRTVVRDTPFSGHGG